MLLPLSAVRTVGRRRRVALDQVAIVCATNHGHETEAVLPAFVDATSDADSATIPAFRQSLTAPFRTACLRLPAAGLQRLGLDATVARPMVGSGLGDQSVIRRGIGVSGSGIVSLPVLDMQTNRRRCPPAGSRTGRAEPSTRGPLHAHRASGSTVPASSFVFASPKRLSHGLAALAA